MVSALERAIEGLSAPNIVIADALRGLLVVSRRINADDATAWLRSELDGFGSDSSLPAHRVIPSVPIQVRFDSFGGRWETHTLHADDLPAELGQAAANLGLRQPVAELAALAGGEHPPIVQLPPAWLARFRQLASENRVPHLEMSVANGAKLQLPQTHLAGVLDRIKSAALDLALDIEQAAADAGGSGGPTVTDTPELAQAVQAGVTNIFASNSNITLGDNTSVASGESGVATQTLLQVGDVAGVVEAARQLLQEEGVQALAEALERDGGTPQGETRTVLARVAAGGYLLAAGITQNAAYDGLLRLLGMAFPGFAT